MYTAISLFFFITTNLFKFILEFLDFLLHMLQVLPMLYVLPFKLFELRLTVFKFIIKSLIITNEEKNDFRHVTISMSAQHIWIIDKPLVSSYVSHAQTPIPSTLYYSPPFSL